mgnify:CR=1 FL=1
MEGNDFSSEIASIISAIDESAGKTEGSGTVSEGKNEQEVRDGKEAEEQEEKGGTEEREEEVEPTNEFKETDESKEAGEEVDDKDSVIEELRRQIAELQAEIGTQKTEQPKEAEQPKTVIEPVPFFENDEEYDKAFEDRKTMEKVLHRVHTKAVESVLTAIPQIVDNVVKMQVAVNMRAADFYSRNKDLKPYAGFVGKVANDLVGKNPSVTMDDLFGNDEQEGLLGKEVRKRLALKRKAEKAGNVQQPQKERPAFIKKPAGARVKEEKEPNLSPIERQIMDLLD